MSEDEPIKNPVFYTVREVAKICKMEETTITEACRTGRIGAQKILNKWRISQESLDELLGIIR